MTEAEARLRALQFANSYTRMEAVLGLHGHVDALEWFRILGEEWSVCDNIAAHRVALRRILENARPEERLAMMQPDEIERWRRLPVALTFYRGCYQLNRTGLSWSLSRATAARFPTLPRYRRPRSTPLILTGRVARDSIVLNLDREEDEVIAARVDIIGTNGCRSLKRKPRDRSFEIHNGRRPALLAR